MNKNRVNRFIALGIAIVGLILYLDANNSIRDLGYDALGASFFPKLAAFFLIIFSLGLFISTLKKTLVPNSKEEKNKITKNKKRIAYFLVITILYIFILPKIGFIFSTIFFLMSSYILMNQNINFKNILIGIIFASFCSYLLWLIFAKTFGLLLP